MIFATAETKKAANLLERLAASKYGMFSAVLWLMLILVKVLLVANHTLG